jgi:hypothetical protein
MRYSQARNAAGWLGYQPAELLSNSLAADIEDLMVALERTLHLHRPSDCWYVPARFLPAVIRALGRDYGRYLEGKEDWNSPIALVACGGGPTKLKFCELVQIPDLPKDLLVLDGTADPARIRLLFQRPDLPLHEVPVPIKWLRTIHVQTNGSRRRMRSSDCRRLDAYLRRVISRLREDGLLLANQRLLLVTHGSRANGTLETHFKRCAGEVHPGPVEARHFGELRGSNAFSDVDAVVTIGDAEPSPFDLLDRYRCLFLDDPKALSVEMKFPKGGARYLADERLEAFRRCWVEEEIAQIAFRSRPLQHPGQRTFVHIGSMWPTRHLGPPDSTINPHLDLGHQLAQNGVRRLVPEHRFYANILAYAAGWAEPEQAWQAYPAVRGQPIDWSGLCAALCDVLELAPLPEGLASYSERGFRDIAQPLTETLPACVFDPATLGVSRLPRFKVLGDARRFAAVFQAAIELALQRRPAPATVPITADALLSLAESSVPPRLRATLVFVTPECAPAWPGDVTNRFRTALVKLFAPVLAQVNEDTTIAMTISYETGTKANKNNTPITLVPVSLRADLPSGGNSAGEGEKAEALVAQVYRELRRLAHHFLGHEAPGQLMQTTALVHEAYLRLVGSARRPRQRWNPPNSGRSRSLPRPASSGAANRSSAAGEQRDERVDVAERRIAAVAVDVAVLRRTAGVGGLPSRVVRQEQHERVDVAEIYHAVAVQVAERRVHVQGDASVIIHD